MDALESSTRHEMPAERIFLAVTGPTGIISTPPMTQEAPRPLTDIAQKRSETLVARQWDDQTLDRSNGRRKRQDASIRILLSRPVRVLKQRIEDSTDTERRLDDVWREFPAGFFEDLAFDLDEVWCENVFLAICSLHIRFTVHKSRQQSPA